MLTSKIISKRVVDGNEVAIYRHPIIAGMEFCYVNGRTKKDKMRAIGYYDYEITSSPIGETLLEKRLKTVFYKI